MRFVIVITVLLYCFDLGHYDNNNGSGVFAKSKIGETIEARELDILAPSTYMTCDFDSLPYFLIGDKKFPLKIWLMRPYPSKLTKKQRIFNCLSQACRTIENGFGILCARWRMFYTPIKAKVENVKHYVLACLSFHNYLRLTYNTSYCPNGFTDSYDATGNLQ